MTSSFLYSLKVWLTAVFIAPIGLFMIFSDAGLDLLLLSWSLGFLFSIPSWLLLCVFSWIGLIKIENNIHRKLTLSVFAMVLTLVTFLIFANTIVSLIDLESLLIIGFPYLIIILIGIFFYRLERKPTSTPTAPNIEPLNFKP